MTTEDTTTNTGGLESTVVRRKPMQATIEALRAAGPRTLTLIQLQTEFGPALRLLWQDGFTADEAADVYIEKIGGAPVRLRKQILGTFKRMFAEFENGSWRPGVMVDRGQSDQKGQDGENAAQAKPEAEQKKDSPMPSGANTSAENGNDPEQSKDDEAPPEHDEAGDNGTTSVESELEGDREEDDDESPAHDDAGGGATSDGNEAGDDRKQDEDDEEPPAHGDAGFGATSDGNESGDDREHDEDNEEPPEHDEAGGGLPSARRGLGYEFER